MSVCKNCGWLYSGRYCPRCGTEFVDESETETSDVTLSSSATELKVELKRNLWAGMHGDCVDKDECVNLARSLIECDSEDYYANFTLISMTGNEKAVSNFLNESREDNIAMYADAILDYMHTRITDRLYCAIRDYADKSPAIVLLKYDDAIEKCVPDKIRRRRDKKSKKTLRFVLYGNGYIVEKCKNIHSVKISIPSVFKSKPVFGISYNAFCRCTSLESITIPPSVTSIYKTFSDCASLSAVHIFDIAKWCTIKFTDLANPLIYAHNLYIKEELIRDLIIPDSVTKICDFAFSGCTSLTSITIPASVRAIGDSAFSGCTSLTSITIPDSVISIGDSVFSGCTSLTSITIPDSVISIGDSAFSGCTSLTSVKLPRYMSSLPSKMFRGCTSLTSIDIPYFSSIYSIEYEAFCGCTSLKSISIPMVSAIGSDAFKSCNSLKDVFYPGSQSTWKMIRKSEGNNCLNKATIHYNSQNFEF